MSNRSFEVFLYQKAMAAMGFYTSKQSGILGPKTKEAYRKAKAVWDGQLAAGEANTNNKGFRVAPSSMANGIVSVASREVGTKEEGHNSGLRITLYQESTWLKPAPWPWCAAFVSWVVKEACSNRSLPSDFERPRTAGAWDFERWARDDAGSSVSLIKPCNEPLAGDIVCYKFSHIGIIESVEGSTLTTIEGNTGESGGREGDGVWRKSRRLDQARSLIRFKF